MGDFVDRGYNSVETFQLLLCLKLKYPSHITLLRGNHESRNMTENFTFREEAISRYDMEMYNLFMEVFDSSYQYALDIVRNSYPQFCFPEAWPFEQGIDTLLTFNFWE